MPQHVAWDPAFRTGHEVIDTQHEALLAQCNRLAQFCAEGAVDEAGFDQALAQLKALAHEHFDVEVALLAGQPDSDGDADPAGRDEFEFLMSEIATPANFDRPELQSFLAIWWLGHTRGIAAELASVGV